MNVDLYRLPNANTTTTSPKSYQISVDLRFKNIKAAIPDSSSSSSFMTRAIVGYINEHRPFIPLHLDPFTIEQACLEGAWDLQAAGIADALHTGVTNSLVKLVQDRTRRSKRMRQIGMWGFFATMRSLRSNLAHWMPQTMYFSNN